MKDNYYKIFSLKEMLNKTAAYHKDNIAYELDNDSYTYEKLKEMVNIFGEYLLDLKLLGKRIAIIGNNSFKWELSYLAVMCGGAVAVPLDKSLPPHEIEKLLMESKVSAVICANEYIDIINENKERNKNLKYLISFDKSKEINIDDILEKKRSTEKYQDIVIDPHKMAVMLFTSGTTSEPKIVALSHENICTNLMDIGSLMDVSCSDTFLSILPIHHVFECTVGFLFPLYKGSKIVFSKGIRHIKEELKKYQISIMACVPGVYEMLLKQIYNDLNKMGILENVQKKKIEYQETNFSSKKEIFKEVHDLLGGNIRLFLSGAASLNRDVEQAYRDMGINIMQAYGLTETSPVLSLSTNKNYSIGSVGKIVPSIEAKILNPNSEGIGELAVKGKSVMLGYFDGKKTNPSLEGGYFATGDLAKINKDGYLFICGRKKNVIVLPNGKNIYPEEIETMINNIEGVKESIIFGRAASNNDNVKINAKIVFDRELMKKKYHVSEAEEIYNVLLDEIKKINKKVPKYKAVKGIIVTEEALIKTSTNKLRRQENLANI